MSRLIKWFKQLRKKPEPEPWYVKEHVGSCPFCGAFAWLPEDVKKGSGATVKCGRQKDGTQSPGHGCGRDLFA